MWFKPSNNSTTKKEASKNDTTIKTIDKMIYDIDTTKCF
jgi:hypothetical protein